MPTVAIDVAPVRVGSTETVIVSAPPLHEYNIAAVRFCNTDSSTRYLTIFCYSGSGPGSDANTEYKTLSIGAASTFEYGPVILAASRKITAVADQADKITASVHGWDVS